MHAHAHPIYMARKNLSEIAHYADLSLSLLDSEGERLPQWLFYKISAVRTHMKDVGHFLRYESHIDRTERKTKRVDERERKYGATHPSLAPKMLEQILEYALASDEILAGVEHRLPQWVDHKLSICAEYMDCVGHCLEHEAGEGRRYSGPTWNTQAGRIGIKRGFELQGAMHRGEERRYAASTRRPERPPEPGRETLPPAALTEARHPSVITAVSLSEPGPGDTIQLITTEDDFGGAAVGGANMNKSRPPEDFMPGLRMHIYENRMARRNRMLHRQPPEAHQPQGVRRRYGVPGFVYGEPGWAGQGGVQTFPPGSARPRAVQTYGSLGYASMGDGSMDMARRGGRRYAGSMGQMQNIKGSIAQTPQMRGRPLPADYDAGSVKHAPAALASRGRKYRKLKKNGG